MKLFVSYDKIKGDGREPIQAAIDFVASMFHPNDRMDLEFHGGHGQNTAAVEVVVSRKRKWIKES